MERASGGDTRSELSGSAADVVQARDVAGGIHFHRPAPAYPLPRQLPGDVAGFVDRQDELRGLDAASAPGAAALVVVVGAPGVGKTSLTLHWAHRVRERFPDGQLYVNLHGYGPGTPVTPRRALESLLTSLGIAQARIPQDEDDCAALYRSLLADRRMLILLDNVASVRQIRPLLPGTRDCLVLATSRSRLSGLVVRDGAYRMTLDLLSDADAVELLESVTRRQRSGDDPALLHELARLCARLPLALRIAGERAVSHPWMPLDGLLAELRNESMRWRALTAEEGDDTDAVRTVFASSYRALPEKAARLFRVLAMHPGTDIGTRAAAVLMAETRMEEVRRWLDVLVGAHLLEQHAPDRFQFHELLRSYAMDQGRQEDSSRERRDLSRRVLRWYLHTADAAQAWINPNEQHVALDPPGDDFDPLAFDSYGEAAGWYEQERGNLVAATRTAAETGLHEVAWKLAIVLRALYMRFTPIEDWVTTAELGLQAARRARERSAEAELLESLGMAYAQAHQLDRSAEFHRAALDIRRELGDQAGVALSLNDLGLVYLRSHRLDEARQMFEDALTIHADQQDSVWIPVVAANLGEALGEMGRYAEAEERIRTALEAFRQRGDRGGEGNALRLLSMVRRRNGDPAGAVQAAERAVEISVEHRNTVWEGFWRLELGRAQRSADRLDDALAAFQRAAALQQQNGDRDREAQAWDEAGVVQLRQGHITDAITLHRRAASVFAALGDRWRQANALSHLAAAQRSEGNTTEANHSAQTALDLLTDFTDPPATELRQSLANG